jgi:predicted phosphodiesterase
MRVLIISDIHANLVALETVLADAKGSFDLIWCLGDTVGYGPQPDDCVSLVREMAAMTVVGNHDWAALGRMDAEDFNPEARRAVLWTRGQISAENMTWLSELPSTPVECEGFTLTHASPRDPIWEYVTYMSVAHENLKNFSTGFCLVGHTHVPALFVYPGRESRVRIIQPEPNKPLELLPDWRGILNPGSVGQPRDADRRAAYAILDTEQGTWEQRRVEYAIETTQARMRAANLPERLINRLAYGQ